MTTHPESIKSGDVLAESVFSFKTMDIKHFDEMREFIEKLDTDGKLSHHEVFRIYIKNKRFQYPETFPSAKSIIILATFSPWMKVPFQYKGTERIAILPSNYFDDGISEEVIQNTVQTKIIKEPGYRIEKANRTIHLKHIAVRSGLAKYGRNNIAYVDGMGSHLTLHAYYTDFVFQEDNWQDLQMMDECNGCQICMNDCPTSAISDDEFVIDVDRCIPLYNEIVGEIPDWMEPDYHNSLMGCIRCQQDCPANIDARTQMIQSDVISEEETNAILNESYNEELMESISIKLKGAFSSKYMDSFKVLTRNLRLLISV